MPVAGPPQGMMQAQGPYDFSKVRVGLQTLDDAIVTFGQYQAVNPQLGDRKQVLQAIVRNDLLKMQEISYFFYRVSGIYNRLCRYMAYLYRYDWFITPFYDNVSGLVKATTKFNEQSTEKEIKTRTKNLSNFITVLNFFDRSELKRLFGEIALEVVKFGCYYGYVVCKKDKLSIQELPSEYCRSRFKVNNRPAIEFNMAYFDKMFKDEEQRKKMLDAFPPEFKKGYNKMHSQRAKNLSREEAGWYLLDTKFALKFNINNEDFPPFISVIPAIIDLDQAQALDKKKMAQKLLKIIIQKMPLDKNGDLIFDVDEAQELHNNAVRMLGRAIGIDVLTTFADVDVADMSDRSNLSTVDELSKVERTVYNEAGVSQLQFNSDGNTALQNSILNDEASMYNLLTQFESFLNLMLDNVFNKKPKQVYYQAQLLTTTVYNYKELAKLYKEQAQMGYNKMLPQVALGQSQSSIYANAYFENDVLDLVKVFIPPLTSNVMNAQVLQQSGFRGAAVNSSTQGSNPNNGEGAGRPEKEDAQKSDKTIANRQSM